MKAAPTLASVGWCEPCGKRLWATRADGKRARKAFHPGDHLSVYKCLAGRNGWHIGHLPAPVLHGELGRAHLVAPHRRRSAGDQR